MKAPVRLQQFAVSSLLCLGIVLSWDPAGLLASPAEVHSTVTYSATAQTGHVIFNPQATLSTDQIDYATPHPLPTILPDDANPETTPVTTLDGINVPEESPEGGYPTHWRDNSPVYSDGWTLLVDDSTPEISVRWIAPTPDNTDTSEYGAGNDALCGTDAQCADYSRSIGEEPSGYAKGK